MPGVTWGFGEVIGTDQTFNTKTDHDLKKTDGSGKPISTLYRGEIKLLLTAATTGANQGTPGTPVVAYPINMNMTRIPLIGEHVLCVQAPGNETGVQETTAAKEEQNKEAKETGKGPGVSFDLEWYYFDPITLQGSVHANLNPGANVGTAKGPNTNTTQDGEKKPAAIHMGATVDNPNTNSTAAAPTDTLTSQNKPTTLPGNEFKEIKDINNLQPFEGDVILQGRHGNTIRLGGTIAVSDASSKDSRYQKMPTWEAGDAGPQAPIIILRAGQSDKEKNADHNYVIEKIDEDKSSIYICSGQKVPIIMASPKFDALRMQTGATPDSYENEAEYTINSTHCNASGADVNPTPAMVEPLPKGCEGLAYLGDFPRFNTGKGEEVAMLKCYSIQGKIVMADMCEPFLKMLNACKKETGQTLQLNSCYRGVRTIYFKGKQLAQGQLDLRIQNANKKGRTPIDVGPAAIKDKKSLLWRGGGSYFHNDTAKPGFSKHQNGTGFDIQARGKTYFKWLVYNSWKYGFIRTVPSEDWHFEYDPKRAKNGPFAKVKPDDKNWHGHGKTYQKDFPNAHK